MDNSNLQEKSVDILLLVSSVSQYVEYAIKSAASQIGNYKIYLIENNVGSWKYSEKLKSLASAHNAEYIFFEQRLPMSENWQRALNVGKSKWLCYLHDDDVWPKHHLLQAFKETENFDIIFCEYKFFRNQENFEIISEEGCIKVCKSREALLARMIDSYNHASATFIRRSVDLIFPANLSLAIDQYGFRQAVAMQPAIRVGWYSSATPVLIRQHKDNITWKVLHLGATENAICYQGFFSAIANQALDKKSLSLWLFHYYDNLTLARIFSANIKKRACLLVIHLILISGDAKRSIMVLFLSLLRGIFQNLVWKIKSLKYDRPDH